MATPAQPKQSVEVALAVLAETVRNMDKKLDEIARDKADKTEVSNLSGRVEKIEGHINKLVWLVIGAVVLALIGGGYLVNRSPEPRQPVPVVQSR